jgi:DNA invertase Pin-like site-specific DNA recombinase
MFEEIPKNCRYAYARVSSKSQEDNSSLESQTQEFLKLGVPEKNIRVEVGSAADTIQDRPIFYHLIDSELKENDLLLLLATGVDFLPISTGLIPSSRRFLIRTYSFLTS